MISARFRYSENSFTAERRGFSAPVLPLPGSGLAAVPSASSYPWAKPSDQVLLGVDLEQRAAY